MIFDDADEPQLSRRNGADAPLAQIKTRQIRRLHSRQVGEVQIEHTYIDRPASLDTWIDHCGTLAAEFGISVLDAHGALFAQLPEIFGR